MVHHDNKRNYTFTAEALEVMDKYFDDNKDKVEILNEFDFFAG